MTQEEKQLLLKDLCARLPYGVKLRYVEDLVVKKESHIITLNNIYLEHILNGDADIKPYLRPMSSMTEEEKSELRNKFCYGWNYKDEGIWDFFYHHKIYGADAELLIDWLNERHFDYRRLIPSGLAIEVTEENNPYKD